MKRILFCAALLCAAGLASADELVARNGKDSVRITEQPCAEPVLGLIPPNVREHFRAAFASIEGKQYAACWALRPDGMVHLVYSDSDQGLVPASQFRPAPGV